MRLNHFFKITFLLGSVIFFSNCSDTGSGSKNNGDFIVQVLSAEDSSLIGNANVVLYNANSNEAITRESTGSDGKCAFDIDPGNYYAKISAQGFKTSPPANNTPIPFSITGNEDVARTFYLNPLETPEPGQISGSISPLINNVLMIAANSNAEEFSTVTGPDGYFVLYNLPYGTYTLQGYKEGYQVDSLIQVELNSTHPSASVNVNMKATNGAVLKGKVTFLAVGNSYVDISLINPASFSTIPGLTTFSDTASLDYMIDNIPDGTFQAWASFKNDGYVMDPDWIFRNPGVLTVNFSENDTLNLNFSVTGAIKIISPTNPADSIYAVTADSSLPTFSWEPYPSAKEYIIEVRKLNGDIIWGGYNQDGSINHPQINQQTYHVVFNFDGSASETLVPGEIYQWKIYADNGRDPGVQTLISSSEDQLGIFTVK